MLVTRNSRKLPTKCRFYYEPRHECSLLVAVREFMDCEHFCITCQFIGNEYKCILRAAVIGEAIGGVI